MQIEENWKNGDRKVLCSKPSQCSISHNMKSKVLFKSQSSSTNSLTQYHLSLFWPHFLLIFILMFSSHSVFTAFWTCQVFSSDGTSVSAVPSAYRCPPQDKCHMAYSLTSFSSLLTWHLPQEGLPWQPCPTSCPHSCPPCSPSLPQHSAPSHIPYALCIYTFTVSGFPH